MGLRVLIASLAPLFIATMFCGWYFRDTGSTGAALPALPLLLIGSTILLVWLSAMAEKAARLVRGKSALSSLRFSLYIGLAFLFCQTLAWEDLISSDTGEGVHPMFAFNFYLMTALHAAHVLGGLVYTLASLKSFDQDGDELPQRLRNHAVYWHFLGLTWLGIIINLFAIRIPNPEDSFLAPLSLAVCALLLLMVLSYQWIAVRLLWRRGERTFALFSVILPIAFLHIWARGEELNTQKMALRWGIAQGLLLIAMMFAGTLHLGKFAGNFTEIEY
ncbi:MAG: cytochrome c oxidase subunit 3 [Myxococcota bacterium]|jgi:cytochrome c oxidase subunit 3